MEKLNEGLMRYLSEAQLSKLSKCMVGIAGCGGIGSNVAMNLVRSGFKNFVLVDFDYVESSNLNRQFYFSDQVGLVKVDALADNLSRICSDLHLRIYSERVEEGNVHELFKNCDIVVEAFDCPQAKAMLVSNMLDETQFLLACSGMAGIGNSDEIMINKKSDKFYIVGDMKTGVSKDISPISPRVNVCAAKMADIILNKVINDA